MRKMILIAGFSPEEVKILSGIAAMISCRVRVVPPQMYSLRVSQILEGDLPAGAPASEAVIHRFLLMSDFTRPDLDEILKRIRQSSLAPVPYKAMVTPVSREWAFDRLYEEIVKEHHTMHPSS